MATPKIDWNQPLTDDHRVMIDYLMRNVNALESEEFVTALMVQRLLRQKPKPDMSSRLATEFLEYALDAHWNNLREYTMVMSQRKLPKVRPSKRGNQSKREHFPQTEEQVVRAMRDVRKGNPAMECSRSANPAKKKTGFSPLEEETSRAVDLWVASLGGKRTSDGHAGDIIAIVGEWEVPISEKIHMKVMVDGGRLKGFKGVAASTSLDSDSVSDDDLHGIAREHLHTYSLKDNHLRVGSAEELVIRLQQSYSRFKRAVDEEAAVPEDIRRMRAIVRSAVAQRVVDRMAGWYVFSGKSIGLSESEAVETLLAKPRVLSAIKKAMKAASAADGRTGNPFHGASDLDDDEDAPTCRLWEDDITAADHLEKKINRSLRRHWVIEEEEAIPDTERGEYPFRPMEEAPATQRSRNPKKRGSIVLKKFSPLQPNQRTPCTPS